VGNCAGIDWASEKHDVLIADEAGGELLAATFAHSNGKVERFHQTMEREWAKGVRYHNSTARNNALPH
jgi:hypothetical protein